MTPHLLHADSRGRIKEHPHLLMGASLAGQPVLPDSDWLVPLPEESDLFFLPERKAVGYDPKAGKFVEADGLAVSAFAAPGYTLSSHPLYVGEAGAPALPLFAYGAVGYWRNRFWICAKRVDADKRQQFAAIRQAKIRKMAQNLLQTYPENRLLRHIVENCVFRYGCPAAKNFALGRFEAPLPTSRACNAHCLGCISQSQPQGAAAITPQCRLAFTPDSEEIVQIMHIHEQRERKKPIYSFGQGCEGDPILNWRLLAESIAKFRRTGGSGTVNCNTNASMPDAVASLCEAGLTSMRVSLNSARDELYEAYYRPAGYTLAHVRDSIKAASSRNVFVSLNLLFFPGLTDTAEELKALARLCAECGVSMIQWRNLNVDPAWYLARMGCLQKNEKPLGLAVFMKALHEKCPWLRYGYFNPWLGSRAALP